MGNTEFPLLHSQAIVEKTLPVVPSNIVTKFVYNERTNHNLVSFLEVLSFLFQLILFVVCLFHKIVFLKLKIVKLDKIILGVKLLFIYF